MALPAPNLDDRRFEDLVADAHRLVRQRCPEWTDHNLSDPGVTLIEAFAYLTESLLYRLNRVPDRLHLKFLDLIGLRLRPPTPARTSLTFWLSAPASATLTIPRGTQAATVRTDSAEPIVFSTTADVIARPCRLAHVRTKAVDEDESVERSESFPAFSDPPADGDELRLGLDTAVPGCAVRLDFDGRVEGLGVDPRRPPLVWEARTDDGWTRCDVDADETGGLNRPGGVVLHVPGDHVSTVEDGVLGGWLRARIVPPAEGLPRYTASPVVTELTACTVGVTGSAVHAELIDYEVLGRAEGTPGGIFRLASTPVLGGMGDCVVDVESADGWQEWHEVGDFADSGPDDRHFVIDHMLGELRFGPVLRLEDGRTEQHGAVPPLDATVRVRRYATGGGVLGNVTPGTVTAMRSSVPFVSAVENRRSAQGGTDAETLDQARDRAPALLRTRNRAVTAEDYEALAAQAVPEAARVRCVTAGDGDVPAGTVKVLVVPAAAAEDGRIRFADLVPDAALLQRLAERLDQVRLVGTRVLVEPPLYSGLTVVARLAARPRTDAEAIREQAMATLFRTFNPLPGGGLDGSGWPFGRSVRVGDVYALLQQVRGVEFVEDVRLFGANPVTGERGDERTQITLSPNSLVFSFDHQVRVETKGTGR